MQKRVFPVEGMKCVHCQSAVQNAVSQLDGVVKAKVSLSPGSLEVEFDENVVTIDALRSAVSGCGNFVLKA